MIIYKKLHKVQRRPHSKRLKANSSCVRVRNFRRGRFLADEHTAPREVGAGRGLLLGFCFTVGLCRAKLVGQDLSGKIRRARLVRQGLSGKAGREGQR
ncbi:hypothetical protein ACFX2G_020116 [Malus domestica]